MNKERIESGQTALRIRFNISRLWSGILLAFISLIICKSGGASGIATIVISSAFLLIAVIEVCCLPQLTNILIIAWSIMSLFATVFTSKLWLREIYSL